MTYSMLQLHNMRILSGSLLYVASLQILVLGMLLPGTAMAAPDLDDFNLVFSDEFNGTELDASKWNTGFLWGPYLPINNEEQLYVDELGINADAMQSNGGSTPSPFEMTGNSLKIIATPVDSTAEIPPRPAENDPIWDQYPEYRFNGDDPTDPDDSFYDPANVNYLSGLITSYEAFRFTHGYAEARVKLPEGQGLWPAFWLLTSFYVEDVPEIDIMEFLGHDKETLYHTYHYFEPLNGWNQVSTPSFTSSHSDFTADWHTFGMSWGPKEIVWYVDGVEARRITDAEYVIPNQAMYVLANLATGGNWPGSPDSTTPLPAEYELDYIRVYQKEAPDTITQAALNDDYHLMFEDNFDGNALDTSKWNTHHLWGPYWQINNEEQFYPDVSDTHSAMTFNSSPVSVSNGTLKITADTVDSTELPVMPESSSADFQNHPEWRHSSAYNNPNYQNSSNDSSQAAAPFLPEYTSGIVTTYDSFKFTHGYAEIRAKLPQGSGLWPAFWLLNGYYVDQQPEIDVIELRGENPNELVHSYHLSPKDGGPPSYSWTSVSNDPGGFTGEYHTYGIAWESGRLDWYIDGVKKHSHTGPSVSSQNMYVLMNLAVGGNFVGAVDSSILPKSFAIDYLRIYQLQTVPFGASSNPVDYSLNVGTEETGEYGWQWGSHAHKDVVVGEFSGTSSDISLTMTGYDVDRSDEVSVWLNGVELGYLSKGPNNEFNGGDSFTILAATQLATNTLEVRQSRVSGWKWGVTDILISEQGSLSDYDYSLVLGSEETGEYGWQWGSHAHKDVVVGEFSGTSSDITLTMIGYDVDSVNEVSVWLNGTQLGYLSIGQNNGFNGGDSFTIPAATQLATNTLEVRQSRVSGWKWGVTDILISEP